MFQNLIIYLTNCCSMHQHFFGIKYYRKFLKMAPTPNFGVFSDFVRPFLSGVDFSPVRQVDHRCLSKPAGKFYGLSQDRTLILSDFTTRNVMCFIVQMICNNVTDLNARHKSSKNIIFQLSKLFQICDGFIYFCQV